jgi:putative effector of murein hydrolase LrgA (UPF0299 family)
MIRENLNQWDFVIAVYVIGIVGTLAMVGWAWQSMKRAEKRRDEVKRK